MNKLLTIGLMALTFTSCDQIKEKADELKDTPIAFDIPGSSIHQTLDTTSLMGSITISQDSSYLDIRGALDNQGVKTEKIKSIMLKSMEITLDSGMTTFDFLSSFSANIATATKAKVKIGELPNINDGTNKLIIPCNFDMKPYIDEKLFNFSFTISTDKPISKKSYITVKYSYNVEATILK